MTPDQREVLIRYTNYRGETAMRKILPLRLRFGSNQWHPEPQWLLDAVDLEKRVERSFAIKDVSEWNAIHHVSGAGTGDKTVG